MVYVYYIYGGSSSSKCTLIVYGDIGDGIENCKLCNILIHVLYTSLVSVWVVSHGPTLFSRRNVIACSISAPQGALIPQAVTPLRQSRVCPR